MRLRIHGMEEMMLLNAPGKRIKVNRFYFERNVRITNQMIQPNSNETQKFLLEFIIYQQDQIQIIKEKKFEEITRFPNPISLSKYKNNVDLPIRKEDIKYRIPSEIRCEYFYFHQFDDEKLSVHYEKFDLIFFP